MKIVSTSKKLVCLVSLCVLMAGVAQADVLYQDNFDNDSLAVNISGIGGGAVNRTIQGHSWTDDGDATFVTSGTTYTRRAILYSANAFQSDTGFRLTVNYTTGSIEDLAAHNLSFGLISSDTDLATYTGYNPFLVETSVYSIGANVTADGGTAARGLNFTDGSTCTTLDESGTRVQFVAGESTKVYIEIGIGGSWNYRINDEYEAHGVLLNGFDPSKSYHVVVYGQDDNGGGKSIQSIKLEKAPAAGERAVNLRGTWTSGVDGSLVDARLKSLETLDAFQVRFSDGASQSALHFAPHKLLESLEGGDAVVPPWGDFELEEPETDDIMDQILNMTSAGFKVKAYSNSENFVGDNASEYEEFVESWFDYCDTDTEVQAFINSQPYHTGIWNRTTEEYEDATATYPNRQYMFCYAEYVLKEYSLRYGEHISSWIFDDGSTMEQMGDNRTSGIIEEQRIFQAFADAVHAGNPDIPLAFNNGRSTTSYDAYPYAIPVRFEDLTFGHAFGGNNNHAVPGGTFDSNYNFITRMTETNGYVHDGGNWTWDDLIVGNFHSKLSTTSWKYGPTQAWEQDDFNQWNLEAMQAGGSMTWDGSYNRSITTIYEWVYVMLEECDAYLAANETGGGGLINVALDGTASQSSTDYGGVPERAIDGDTNGAYSADSVTHTANEAQPWWEVDLGDSYDIDEIVIWGRTDSCCQARLSDYDVAIFDSGSQLVWSDYQADYPDPSVTLNPGGVTGQYVLVQLRGTNALSLAEVQVYGCNVPWTDADFTISDEIVNYSSGSIDISCASSVDISMDIEGVGNMEESDYLNVYYTVDGGSPIAISLNTDSFTLKTVTASGISGGPVEILIDGATSVDTEIYYVSNMSVSEGGNPNIRGEWTFDDVSSSVVYDSTAYGHDGTRSGGTIVTGNTGDAMEFDGDDDSITLPAAAFSTISDEVTVSLWVNGDSIQPVQDVLFRAVDASGNRVLNIHLPWSNSNVYWDAGNSGTSSYDRIFATASTSQFEGQWNHWVFVKDAASGDMTIYVNGSEFHSGSGKTRTMSGITSVTLGSSIEDSWYTGSIDEVILYDVALSESEVSDLYNSY